MQYPGFTNARNGSIAAQRDLRALSHPFLTCTIYTNSDAADLNIGDVFLFNWARWKIANSVMRVVSIAFADGKSKQVRITCTEDVYATPLAAMIVPSEPSWVDPSAPPEAMDDVLAIEAPYLELIQNSGESDVASRLASRPDIGFVLGAGPRPSSAVNGRLWTDSGAGFADVAGFDFCPYARLAAAISKTQTLLPISEAQDLEDARIGSWCQIGDEMMRVDAIDEIAGTVTVGRGILDTVPAAHALGAGVFFWDDFSAIDPTEYVEGEEVAVKLQPASGAGIFDLDAIVAETVEIAARAIRPYAPGDLKVNGESYAPTAIYEGELAISWAHRDRIQQTGGTLADHTAGDIGPEAGTVYRVRGYLDGALVHTEDDIAGTSAAWTPAADGVVKIEVHAKRDGLYSWQAPSHEFLYSAAGVARSTEEGDVRITEDGDIREAEI